eukprot:GHVU01033213.1.p1 GENE.GHVU01033213.1~~GHVU01033213.1.p1  ORF type:complete len:303 (-),score=13.13 GHVU01033213.1:376-1284(-)
MIFRFFNLLWRGVFLRWKDSAERELASGITDGATTAAVGSGSKTVAACPALPKAPEEEVTKSSGKALKSIKKSPDAEYEAPNDEGGPDGSKRRRGASRGTALRRKNTRRKSLEKSAGISPGELASQERDAALEKVGFCPKPSGHAEPMPRSSCSTFPGIDEPGSAEPSSSSIENARTDVEARCQAARYTTGFSAESIIRMWEGLRDSQLGDLDPVDLLCISLQEFECLRTVTTANAALAAITRFVARYRTVTPSCLRCLSSCRHSRNGVKSTVLSPCRHSLTCSAHLSLCLSYLLAAYIHTF